MQFKDIPGHHILKNKLIKSVKDDRVAHAQLFLGINGSANLPLAMAYAQFINCISPLENDSCGTCSSCAKYTQLIHPDLHFSFPIKGAKMIADDYVQEFRKQVLDNPYTSVGNWMETLGNENSKPNITADECRNIIKKMSLKPYEAKFKVLILWMPDYLGKEGNILLKLIEEPKGNALIILCGENENKLLGTIISRVQLTRIPLFTIKEVAEYLTKNKEVATEKAQQIALLSNGNLNKALELINKTENTYFEMFRSWLQDCYKSNTAKYDYWVKELNDLGRERLKSFLEYGLQICRSCLVEEYGLNKGRLTDYELEFVQNLSKIFNVNRLEVFNELLNNAIFAIDRNGNSKIIIIKLSLDVHSCFRTEYVY